jgi:hypothetical protein
MAYPSSVISFSLKVDNDDIEAEHVNTLQTEVTALEDGLLNGFAHILKPTTHNTRDLGLTGTRWKDLYLAGNADVDGALDVAGALTVGGVVTLAAPAAYTPAWTNTGTANSLGNGTITGLWEKVGKRVNFQATLTWGSTTSAGNGNWVISLPATTVSTVVGDSLLYDNSATTQYRTLLAFQAASSTTIFPCSASSPAVAIAGGATPFTWATSDFLIVSGWFWVA